MTSTSPTRPVRGLLLFPGAGRRRDTRPLVRPRPAPLPPSRCRSSAPTSRTGARAAGRPTGPPKLIACVVEEAALLADSAGVAPDRLVLGGRSMGGRMCSMAVAEGLPAAGLVLIAYPLHPPGKPDRLRIEHLPDITVPCLFVSGTRDPFGTPDEMEAHTATIPGPVTHVWIDGGRHDLKGADAAVAAAVVDWAVAL